MFIYLIYLKELDKVQLKNVCIFDAVIGTCSTCNLKWRIFFIYGQILIHDKWLLINNAVHNVTT